MKKLLITIIICTISNNALATMDSPSRNRKEALESINRRMMDLEAKLKQAQARIKELEEKQKVVSIEDQIRHSKKFINNMNEADKVSKGIQKQLNDISIVAKDKEKMCALGTELSKNVKTMDDRYTDMRENLQVVSTDENYRYRKHFPYSQEKHFKNLQGSIESACAKDKIADSDSEKIKAEIKELQKKFNYRVERAGRIFSIVELELIKKIANLEKKQNSPFGEKSGEVVGCHDGVNTNGKFVLKNFWETTVEKSEGNDLAL